MRLLFTPADADDLGALMETADAALDRLCKLYFRIMGRLAHIAERVEAAWDLDPMPQPKRDPPPKPPAQT